MPEITDKTVSIDNESIIAPLQDGAIRTFRNDKGEVFFTRISPIGSETRRPNVRISVPGNTERIVKVTDDGVSPPRDVTDGPDSRLLLDSWTQSSFVPVASLRVRLLHAWAVLRGRAVIDEDRSY